MGFTHEEPAGPCGSSGLLPVPANQKRCHMFSPNNHSFCCCPHRQKNPVSYSTPANKAIKRFSRTDISLRTCPRVLTRKSQVLHLNSWHASTKFPRGLDLGYRSSINAYRCYLHKRVFVNPAIPKSKLVLV